MKKLTRFIAVCLLIILASFAASFACSGHIVGAAKEVAKERVKAVAEKRLKGYWGEYIGCEFYCVDNAGFLQHGFLPKDAVPNGEKGPIDEDSCREVSDITLNCVTRAMYHGMQLVPVSIPPQQQPEQETL